MEETLLTLNYASRAMNIKSQPVVSYGRGMGLRPVDLVQENEELRRENFELREQLLKALRGGSANVPQSLVLQQAHSAESQTAIARKKTQSEQVVRHMDSSQEKLHEVVNSYNDRLEKLRQKLAQSREERESSELTQVRLQNENRLLHQKLRNLESLFLASSPTAHSASPPPADLAHTPPSKFNR